MQWHNPNQPTKNPKKEKVRLIVVQRVKFCSVGTPTALLVITLDSGRCPKMILGLDNDNLSISDAEQILLNSSISGNN